MKSLAVIGAQWGDEGKGKITDFLAEQADMVVRCQGGNNAGHTVISGGEEYKLHLVPSGILYPKVECIIGNGVVVDLESLFTEIDGLESRGIDCSGLKISDRAHLILPYHRQLDALQESTKVERKIGTTKRGIGPAYTDKAARDGIRLCDLLDAAVFKERLHYNLQLKRQQLEASGETLPDEVALLEKFSALAERIRPYIAATASIVNKALAAGKKVLFEGAQGVLLDIDHGTYPFVTSSNSTAGGICTGAGVGPTKIKRVLGIAKAYSTRVGDGPFPTEITGELGEKLRQMGGEFGTTTGRPRRCGWLDLAALQYATQINGFTDLTVTKLDVLDTFAEIKICTGYRYQGSLLDTLPADLSILDNCEPVYETMPGWQQSTRDCRNYHDLPTNARSYIEYIEKALQTPVSIVAVGPGREETIIRESFFA